MIELLLSYILAGKGMALGVVDFGMDHWDMFAENMLHKKKGGENLSRAGKRRLRKRKKLKRMQHLQRIQHARSQHHETGLDVEGEEHSVPSSASPMTPEPMRDSGEKWRKKVGGLRRNVHESRAQALARSKEVFDGR